jgi:amidase
VAAGLCVAALGTETAGSIVYPATVCGVVGLKPTVGLTSRDGVIPATISADTVGPLARTVADAATVLAAIAEPDAPSATGIAGLRVGVARQIGFGQSRHADAAAEAAIETLRTAGVEIVDPVEIPSAGAAATQETIAVAVAHELRHALNAYLVERADPAVRSIADLIAFNERHAEQELSRFGQEILHLAQAMGGPLTDPAYLDARAQLRRWGRDEGIDAALRQHRLAAILVPTTGPALMTDDVNGDHPADAQCELAAFAGYPAITVPAGQVRGLPLGVMLMSTAYSEPALVRLARLLEPDGPAWRPPA